MQSQFELTGTIFNLRLRKIRLHPAPGHFCRSYIMNIMSRYALRLVGIGAFAIAFPQFGSASDSENRATVAMGPTSAAQKNQGQPTTSDTTVPIPKPRDRHNHKNMHS
jgi:hypothetical protein